MHRIVPIAIASLGVDATKFASCARNSGARLWVSVVSVIADMTTSRVSVNALADRLAATPPIARNESVDLVDAPRFARFAHVEAILRQGCGQQGVYA
jgi:hypothetical protein